MSQPTTAQELSMEEILASIRRSIIPDDEAGEAAFPKAAAEPNPAAKAAPKNSHDEIDAARAGSDAAGGRKADDPAEAQVTADRTGLAEGTQAKASPTNGIDRRAFEEASGPASRSDAQESRERPDRPLLSPRTTAAVDSAFSSLSHTMLGQNPRTLEDLVRDMLKPMLKAWLDDNLPHLVERLVRAEIERVSRGRK